MLNEHLQGQLMVVLREHGSVSKIFASRQTPTCHVRVESKPRQNPSPIVANTSSYDEYSTGDSAYVVLHFPTQVDDLLGMQNCNLHNLPENYTMRYCALSWLH